MWKQENQEFQFLFSSLLRRRPSLNLFIGRLISFEIY